MSAADRLARVAACVRHGRECHEEVTRKGELQPCSKPAVALRDSRETDTYYPVCAYHARGFCIPLVDPDDAAALVAALRAVLDLHREARNDMDRTPPCPHCHGEPGIHECGCWADEKWPTVCAVCMEGTKGASVAWPCPTIRAIEEELS